MPERGALSRSMQAVAQAIEGQFPGSVVRRHAVRDVQVLNAKQQSLELELDGLGHKVLLSDTSPEAFRPLGLETAPRAPGALQARAPGARLCAFGAWRCCQVHALSNTPFC